MSQPRTGGENQRRASYYTGLIAAIITRFIGRGVAWLLPGRMEASCILLLLTLMGAGDGGFEYSR